MRTSSSASTTRRTSASHSLRSGSGTSSRSLLHTARQTCALEHERRLVKALEGTVLDDAVRSDVAEQGDFGEHGVLEAAIAAQHDDVGGHAELLQLLHRTLGRLGLLLARPLQVGNEA